MKRRAFIKGMSVLGAYALCPIHIPIPEADNLQVVIDELFNSHMTNVRTVMNNTLIEHSLEMERTFLLGDYK